LDDNYSNEQQAKFFLFGHVHHDGFVRNVPGLTPASKLWNLGKPTDPDDYQPRLRGANGQIRQTPAIIGTTGGFSIYGTGSSNTYNGTRPPDSVEPSGRISYSFYKQSKGRK
jgi:hypothetical protein